MSKRSQRYFAAALLVGAFLLASPAPTLAAGFWKPAVAPGLAVRVWAWLERAGVVPGVGVVWEKEGSMIDPNGEPRTSAPTPPPNALTSRPMDGADGSR